MTNHKIPHLRPTSETPQQNLEIIIVLKDGRRGTGFYTAHSKWFIRTKRRTLGGIANPLELAGWCYPEDLELPPPPPPELPKVTTGRELMELVQEYAAAGKGLKIRLVHDTPGLESPVSVLVGKDIRRNVYYMNEGVATCHAYWLDSGRATVEVLPDEEKEG